MKIPNRIQILGKTFRILYLNQINENSSTWGTASQSDCQIKIKKNLPRQNKEETFIHEVLHLIYDSAKVDHHNEKEVEIISNILYQVLKQI